MVPSAVTVNTIVIAGRPPGGSNDGGPYLDLTPATGATTIQPGATLQVLASRAFTSTDSTGKWYAYATYQDASGVWYDGPNAYFTVGSAPAPAPSSTPVVDAGPNQTITLPSTASLSGTATGFPADSTLTQTWSTVLGTGTVTFSTATALATTASFSTSGLYTLQLTVSGGGVSASGTTIITVNPEATITRVYYVSTTGNDANPGSSSAPWRTIQKAANTVEP